MEPAVVLENVGPIEVKETPTARNERPTKRRKNRRLLFSASRTRHAVRTLEPYEPAGSDYFSGFSSTTADGPPQFLGFSDGEINSSEAESRLHPLHGIDWEDDFSGCGRRVYSTGGMSSYNHLLTVYPVAKRRARVLSLFDGVGTALLVLADKLHLDLEVYFSSEVNPNALLVQDIKLHGRTVQLGNVVNIKDALLDSLGTIDFLCGGPPCNQVSRVNATRKGLSGKWSICVYKDPDSESLLYKEFVRIRNVLLGKAAEHRHPFFWMMEMTANMDYIDLETMTRDIGQKPLKTNSVAHLPVNRERLFWTNVPQIQHKEKRGSLLLDDLLCPGRKANHPVSKTLTSNSSNQVKGGTLPVCGRNGDEKYFILELERLQGLPDNHTAVGNLSITDRRKLVGRAWCVPQVVEILSALQDFFISK